MCVAEGQLRGATAAVTSAVKVRPACIGAETRRVLNTTSEAEQFELLKMWFSYQIATFSYSNIPVFDI